MVAICYSLWYSCVLVQWCFNMVRVGVVVAVMMALVLVMEEAML